MLKTLLLALSLLLLFTQPIFSLEISLQGAKENHQDFSTLHLRDEDKFLCQDMKNDFDEIVKIVCAFSKSPSQKLKKIQNNFFEITTEVKNKTFFLIIKPYERMKLVPIVFDLTKDDTVFSSNVKLSNHWMVIGYRNELPFIKKNAELDVSINFPFTFAEDKFPYVGSLDMQGNPVHVERVGDVSQYIKIKKLYDDKEYEFTLELIDEVIKEYPNSLFTAELLFYKMKAYSKLMLYDELIDVAKAYLKEYSSDENIAEVLSMAAKSYYKIGLGTDADYFFDRLFTEHDNTVYAQWGYIYKGEMLDSSGSATQARLLFKKALEQTSDIDVASTAAYRLAQNFILSGDIKEASVYADKVAKAKPSYFIESIPESIDMMYDFVDSEDYNTGASIAQALFKSLEDTHEEYETLLKNRGVWLSKTKNKKESLEALNLYLKLFPDGLYEQEVKVAKDGLFFDVSDDNVTTKLTNYEKLINEYSGDSIGNKAIYEKAKLLIQNSKFRDALGLEEKLLKLDTEEYKDVGNMIKSSAIGTMKQALEVKECGSVLEIASKYKIELSDEWDDGIYECAMKGADYELAKKMADKNLKSKDLDERKKWLYRYIKIDFATGNYSNVIEASKDLITLIEDKKNSDYKDVYRYLFDTYSRLENSTKMIDTMAEIEKVYGLDYLDIERYVSLISAGSQKKDSNLVILYGEKVMKIQTISNSNAQSPFVEFALYEAYSKKENYNRALEVIKSLDNIELKKNTRARQKYLLGSIYSKLWRDDDAKAAYQDSINADKESSWAKLAKAAQEI
ncbi:tetratricopeptide repeat protein [Candidatus Sulfurimonas baltica]|uniref:Flagellar protein n=1 Tax=Candidatus Sulfurimonas baltica TaxID=2740404 RepID=A0A7S7LVS3_9BACT|nr:flagellar protein [Candidatus Sulfurimonas baltica]QOY52358.1 flagellar protein [Candidatus Sulfurimonas baltica]